jgi:hypothetical protein
MSGRISTPGWLFPQGSVGVDNRSLMVIGASRLDARSGSGLGSVLLLLRNCEKFAHPRGACGYSWRLAEKRVPEDTRRNLPTQRLRP